MKRQFICETITGEELTADVIERCWGWGHWVRDPKDGHYSYQMAPMDKVAAGVNHPVAGPTIEGLAKWVIEEGEYIEASGLYDEFLNALGVENELESEGCSHWSDELQELGFAVFEKMEKLGWVRSEEDQAELDRFMKDTGDTGDDDDNEDN